jgi:Glu-tRNA(Gln) amidotransferase subunit E-like FAD-binding protein
VREGAGDAGIAGWMEIKLGSYCVQDRADVVQVIKATTPAILRRIRKHLGKVHALYLRRFDELLEAAAPN